MCYYGSCCAVLKVLSRCSTAIYANQVSGIGFAGCMESAQIEVCFASEDYANSFFKLKGLEYEAR